MATAKPSNDGSKEYVVRVPKIGTKKYSILKFNPANNVDFTKCEGAKMERENNLKQYKAAYDIDVMPSFGAGSEFGREQREEARRKKYGVSKKHYNPDDQPWLLRLGKDKPHRKFKGLKEGGVTENASYFVFKQSPDGAFEAFPLDEWYNFTPIAKYKSLNAEEAEEEFTRRDKTLNYFSIMVKKRLNKEEEDDAEEGDKKSKSKSKKSFLLTELDEWAMLTDSGDAGSSDEENGEKKPKKKPSKKTKVRKLAKKKGSDAEAEEESDDVDEGREVDYMTDTDSEDDDMYADHLKTDKYEEKGVEDADGLRKIIESDEEEEAKEKENEEEEEDEQEDGDKKKDSDDNSSSSDSDSDPEKDTVFSSALFMLKKDKKKSGSKESSRSNTPTTELDKKNLKRKQTDLDSASPTSKKSRSVSPTPDKSSTPVSVTPPPSSSTTLEGGITEETVRRYLMRKPMTTKDLLQKFKSKNPTLSKEKLVTSIGAILKRLNPEKTQVKDKLFLFIKKN